jgi:hypothetical protein
MIMEGLRFDPFRCILNFAFGWFLFAFLQAAAISLFSGAWGGLWGRFLGIATIKDGGGALINLAAIAVVGGGGTALWLLLRK